jgi:hypothetical protein
MEVAMRGRWGLVLAKVRLFFVTGVLVAFLFVLEMIVGCDANEEEAQVYYGPAPAEDVTGDIGIDGAVYYGPQPMDTIPQPEDTQPPPQDTLMDAQTLYGPLDVSPQDTTPPPVDAMDTALPKDISPDSQYYYGPQPVDAVGDVEPPSDIVNADSNYYYGPLPTDISGADASNWYGPPPTDTVEPTDAVPDKVSEIVEKDMVQQFYGPQQPE